MTDYYEHNLDPVSVKPEWLADDDVVAVLSVSCWVGEGLNRPAKNWVWDAVTTIRIPADHWVVPYLKRGETPPSVKPTTPSPELVERAFALLRRVHAYPHPLPHEDEKELPAILAEYEAATKPVDPDRALAIDIVGNHYEGCPPQKVIDCALAAIKAADARRAEKSA